jgi:hypothetical protein
MAWEDYQAGMYGRAEGADARDLIDSAVELLTSPVAFTDAMHGMLAAWPTAAEHYLTRPGSKSRAWLGAAACMWRFQVPEHCTRVAWRVLTPGQQDAANAAADSVRETWLANRKDPADA